MSQSENFIEDNLIKQLITGCSQWTYRKDIRNEDDLWNNIRNILNSSNVCKLCGVLLTDGEMEQVKEFIKTQAESPYKAALWLSGENGLAQIPIKRDDAKFGDIYLDAIDNKTIAGGNSVYEVINQYVSSKDKGSDRDRRFDVTLLINGFPLIHIELKNQDHPYMDAFRQIKKYLGEGQFRGVFGLIQMFIVSNGVDTKYIAAATYDKLNEKFLSSWIDKNNNPVNDYIAFAKEALNIPQAHLMVGKYAVIDSNSNSLILLRPYQIHAIEAVKEASRRKESGYVWHTTGSGKTITSFNVSRNLLEIPSIEKSIFLIDRKDLDQQTTLSFQSYAKSTGDIIEDTKDTKALENNLKSKDKIVIVATRQKLDCLLDKCNKALEIGDKSAYYYKVANNIKNKNVAFIVDECHRAISYQSKEKISKFFNNSTKTALWYGFTGTPIFVENKKAELGKAARTTQSLYGVCLHKYTIKEALHDHSVLGFKVQNSGFSREELENIAEDKLDIKRNNISEIDRIELETATLKNYKEKTGKNFYDNEQHREKVIDYIINHSSNILMLKAPKGTAYASILTCKSIEIAQKYYQEIKKFISDGKVKENIKRYCPDFPRFAITYSVGENEDGAHANQLMMKESIADYNELFDTKFSIENISAYNVDLNARLSRKQSRYQVREEQLDLVIVVDRLLTGFDAPCLSTLFIDRPPMSPHGIIQAFSRTNRIFNDKKVWGQIVTFQTPALFAQSYEKALQLYSNGGAEYVQAPTFEVCKERFINAVAELKCFQDNPSDIDIDAYSREELKKFVKLYQNFDKTLAAIKTYEEWEKESSEVLNYQKEEYIFLKSNEINENSSINEDCIMNCAEESLISKVIKNISGIYISQKDMDTYQGKYNNAIEKIKVWYDGGIGPQLIDIDIEYQLESVTEAQVDYDYLVSLMQKYFSLADTYAKINDPIIDKYIADIEKKNHKLGEVILGIWEQLKKDPSSFNGKQAIYVINDKIEEIITGKLEEYCDTWKVLYMDMNYFSQYYVPGQVLKIASDYEKYHETGGNIGKLQYLKLVRDLAKQLIEEEIMPLRRR